MSVSIWAQRDADSHWLVYGTTSQQSTCHGVYLYEHDDEGMRNSQRLGARRSFGSVLFGLAEFASHSLIHD